MERPTKEEVDQWLARVEAMPAGTIFRGSVVLAAEVRALQNENAKLSGLVDFQQATIARVEVLPAEWVRRARNARNSAARVRYDQAAFELTAALKGPP